jgi:hypothetical protein
MRNLLTISILSMLLTGCVCGFGASYSYNVAVKNAGQQEIWCSFLGSSKGMAHRPGRLTAGATASISGPFKYPSAAIWTVTWKTADGQEISKKLDLTDKLPKGFKGHLIFTISAKNDLGYVTEKFSEE